MDEEKALSNRLGKGLKTSVPLSQFTSIGVGGVANYFYTAKNIQELSTAVKACIELDLPCFVLGAGSDMIFSDLGYGGLVIKNESSNAVFGITSSEVIVDSGLSLANLLNLAAGRDLGGLEFLAGRPGTVGGAVYGNYSNDSFEVGDFVKSITVLMVEAGEVLICSYPGHWMRFEPYRSIIKEKSKAGFKPVILTVRLQLTKRRKDEILRLLRQNLAAYQNRYACGKGSLTNLFKDPVVKNCAPVDYLLDQVGARRLRVGGAAISTKNANTVINSQNASANDIRRLADQLRESVRAKFGFTLEERIEYIGVW